MSDVGLKSYTKQLTESLDNGSTVYINLNQNDANTIIEIPLFTAFFEKPFDLSILYNYKDLTDQGYFGVGSRLNILKSIFISANTITITNSDGSKDYYNGYGTVNEETNMKVERIIDGFVHYDLVDKCNNKYVFKGTNKSYPIEIKRFGNTYYTFYETNSRLGYIHDNLGDEVSFSFNNNNYVSVITFRHYGTIKYKTYLSYSNNNVLSRVQTKRVSGQVETLIFDTSIIISSNTIIIKNEYNNNSRIECLLTNDKVTRINKYEDLNDYETNIDYYTNRTKVIDYLGLETNVIFSNDFPIYEMDNLGKVVYKEYDNTKKIINESSVLDLYHPETSLITQNLFEFVNDGLVVENYTETNTFYTAFLNNVYKVTGSGSLEKTITINGLASDNLSLIIFGKMLTSTTDNSYVEVRLNWNNYSKFKKINLDDNYEMISLGEVADTSYNSIEVSIVLYGNASVALGGICLLRKDFGNLYTYDNHGNIKDESTGYGNKQVDYYDYNLPKTYVGVDSSCYQFKYDSYGNVLECKTAYDAKINKTYNNNHPTSSVIQNGLGNKGLKTSSTYSSGMLSSFTNELGYITSFSYDPYGRLKKVINALSETEEYGYGDLNSITSYKVSNQNYSAQIEYGYDSMNRITSAILANGSTYSFTYDTKGNISNVLLDNVIIYSFEYDNDNFPIKIKNGNTTSGYSFTYNSDYLLDSIYYVDSNNVSVLKYKYVYNDKKQIYRILDTNNTIIKEYTYDIDGKIISIENSFGNINYQYNNIGELSNLKRDIGNNNIYEAYDFISRSKGSNPQAIIPFICGNNKYVSGIFNDNSCVLLGNNIGYDVSDSIGISYGKDGIIPYVLGGSGLTYYTYPSPLEACGSVAYWFKPTTSLNWKVMFSVKKPSNLGYGHIIVEVINSKLSLSVFDVNNNYYQVLTTSNSIVLNKWNFFSVIFFKRHDEGGSYVSEFALTLNEKTIVRRYQNPWVNYELGTTPEYHVGANSDGLLSISCPITCLSIGYMNNMRLEDLEKYYRATKDYIIENMIENNVVDISNTSLHTFDQSILSSFEIYPLQNSVVSLNGLKPKVFNLRKTSKYDKDRTFNYNKLINHYAYVADGEELIYNLNMSTSGTVVMRAYIDGVNNKQYFFEAKDTNDYRIGLYRGENDLLFLKIDNSSITTNLTFSQNIWHTVGLTFTLDGNDISFRVYLDGSVYETTTSINHSYGNLDLIVGRGFDF